MKKLDISFRHFDGSGPLSIYWHDGPYGDAVEANKGDGVGWFSVGQDLLGVEFDDVEFKKDHQTLFFDSVMIEVKVNNGKIKVVVDKKKSAG